MAGKECMWCRKPTLLFYFLPEGKKKRWICVEHYDIVAAYYKRKQFDDKFSRDMVKENGW